VLQFAGDLGRPRGVPVAVKAGSRFESKLDNEVEKAGQVAA